MLSSSSHDGPRSTSVTNDARVPSTRRTVLEAMRAVLSDDHNYERGLAALHDLIDQVVRDEGASGLGDLTVALSLELAKALDEISQEQGLAAVDLAEVWFAD
jgi:hypothetical protein